MRRRILLAGLFGLIGFIVLLTRPMVSPELAFPDGVIDIAVDPSTPPFAYYAGDELVGIDIDLGRALGDALGLPVRFAPLSLDALYDALNAGTVDLVIASLQPDYRRSAIVTFSRSYFDAGLVLVSPHQINSMRDLPGHALSYEFGSTADAEARRWLRRVAAFETLPYETPDYALDAVRAGLADAALVDAVSATIYRNAHPAWQAEQHHVTHMPYVIAMRDTPPSVQATINDALADLIEQGMLRAIIDRWM
jgi:ABC-type amino acid transport substrate-binding protein